MALLLAALKLSMPLIHPLTNALELERERQKSTLRELELTKMHHKELLNLVTDTAAKREKDLMNSTASSTQAMQPYQGFPFAQFAAALPDARTQPGVYPPGVAVAPAAAPGYEQYMAQLLNQGKMSSFLPQHIHDTKGTCQRHMQEYRRILHILWQTIQRTT